MPPPIEHHDAKLPRVLDALISSAFRSGEAGGQFLTGIQQRDGNSSPAVRAVAQRIELDADAIAGA